MERMRFTKEHLPLGDDQIPVLVGRDGGDPRTVFLSYEAFLDIAAALYTAIETLKAVGVDASVLFGDDEDFMAEVRQIGEAVPRHRAG